MLATNIITLRPMSPYMRMKSELAELKRERFATAHIGTFSPIAWMGGNAPSKPSAVSMFERAYARGLFRKQVNTWRAYWGDSPNWDTLRTFYSRARYDAHATFRSACNG